jgi:ubiquitin C-terminal hydrolase
MTHQFEPSSGFLSLQTLFISLAHTERGIVTPDAFIKNWRGWCKGTLNPREQQDASEFLQTVLDQLPTEVSFLFRGTQVNTIKGVDSDFTSASNEVFWNIGLSIRGFKTLDQSIREFLREETVSNYNANGKRINIQKSSRIAEVPPVLVVQLKRFEYDIKTMVRYKIDDSFEFPIDLDVNEMLATPEDRPITYKLTGIVLHSGTAQGGHYTSFVYHGQWWKFNDDEVSVVGRIQRKLCLLLMEISRKHPLISLYMFVSITLLQAKGCLSIKNSILVTNLI